MSEKGVPSGGQLAKEYKESAYVDHLFQRTSYFLRESGIEIESEQLEQALRISPLGRAVAEMRERLLQAEQKNDIDALTGVPNRAGFISALYDYLSDVDENTENQTAVAFIDLDGFKQVNDKCGHACGDDALQKVAARLQEQFAPQQGIVGRFGGDEMVLFLPVEPNTEHIIKGEIRADIDQALDGLVYWKDSKPYPVGASIGVCIFDFETLQRNGETLRDQISFVLKQADTNMYEEKWGDYNPESDSDPMKAPKNQRLEALRVKYIREQTPLLHWPAIDI